MKVKVTVLRVGESAIRDPAWEQFADQNHTHCEVGWVGLIEDGVYDADDPSVKRASVMLMGRAENGDLATMEMTWQLWHSITGTGLAAFGNPTGAAHIPMTYEQAQQVRDAAQEALDGMDAAERPGKLS